MLSRTLILQRTASASAALVAVSANICHHPSTTSSSASLPHRIFHSSSYKCNTINQHGAARAAGPVRTQKYMSKRMQDRINEEAAVESNHLSFSTSNAFLAQLDATYALMQKGMTDMLAANPSMQFLQSSADHTLEIALGADKGSFTFTPEVTTQRCILFSPISATSYRYSYDRENQRWIADSDSHDLRELFVREILRTDLKGFPQL